MMLDDDLDRSISIKSSIDSSLDHCLTCERELFFYPIRCAIEWRVYDSCKYSYRLSAIYQKYQKQEEREKTRTCVR